MTNLNRFLLNLHRSHRMRNLSLENKQKIIDKILQDKELKEILDPISLGEEENDNYFFLEEEVEKEEVEEEEIEKRIIRKQKEVEKYEKKDLMKNNKSFEKEKITIKIGRFGRTELHEVVLTEDKNKLKYLLKNMEKSYLFSKDNNKHNPFQLALLEEKKELIEIMRPYYEDKL